VLPGSKRRPLQFRGDAWDRQNACRGVRHETSRAKDPALHMHVLIANVTIDPEREEALPLRRAPGLRASTGTQWNQQLLAFLLVDSKTKAEKETFRFRFVPFQGFA
jgi:hypothetical protein